MSARVGQNTGISEGGFLFRIWWNQACAISLLEDREEICNGGHLQYRGTVARGTILALVSCRGDQFRWYGLIPWRNASGTAEVSCRLMGLGQANQTRAFVYAYTLVLTRLE